jgi:monoamine oxidase
MKNIAIIGGGLSGLCAAHALQSNCSITVFEARDRLGGRIYSVNGLDLGPSWIWPHQTRIINLIHSLDLESFKQYDLGEALYETAQGIERFMAPANPPSLRIRGGTSILIERLATLLTATDLHLNEAVISVTHKNNHIIVVTLKSEYEFDQVIVTLPPRLALQSLSYDPPLPDNLQTHFTNTPTWMGNSVKCVIEFKSAFWRAMGLSGFCFTHVGPIGEIHDACTENRHALFGFIRADADMTNIEAHVRAQLEKLFNQHSSDIISFHCIDWRSEKFTSADTDRMNSLSHPQYGFDATHFDGKLQFYGTETSYEDGGYLEGAIASIEHTAKSIGL